MQAISVICAVFSSFFISAIASTIPLPLPESSNSTKKIINFIVESDLKHSTIFGEDTTFLITDNTFEATSMVKLMSDTFQIPFIVFGRGFSSLNLHKLRPCLTFIIVKKKTHFDGILNELLSSNSFRVHTPAALVICDQIGEEEEHEIPELLRRIWTYGLHRSIVIYVSDMLHAKRFNPFLGEINEIPPTKTAVFKNQLTNLHGYKLRVSLFEEWPILKKGRNFLSFRKRWIGRDVTLLDNIMRIVNATYKIVEPPRKTRFIGAIQDILSNKSDFCFVRHFQSTPFDGVEYNEFTDLAYVSLLVPRPRALTTTEAMFKMISVEVWTCILVSLLSMGVSMRIFVYFQHKFRWTLSDVFLDIWSMFIDVASNRFHTYGNVLRISVIFLLWSSLILNVLFQSRLIYLIRFVEYERGIQNADDLRRSKIPIYTPYNLTELTGNPETFDGERKNVNYTDMQRILWHDRPKAAFALAFATIRGYVNPDIFPHNGSISHVMLAEPLAYSYSVYLFKKHSPFSRHISIRILQLRQYGFASEITQERQALDKEGRVKKITLGQVQSAFIILIYGFILSFVVLFGEIILYPPKMK